MCAPDEMIALSPVDDERRHLGHIFKCVWMFLKSFIKAWCVYTCVSEF